MCQVPQYDAPIQLLPIEVLSSILRYLDPWSLLNTACTCKWLKEVCKGDSLLRKKMQRQIRIQKLERKAAILKAKLEKPKCLLNTVLTKQYKMERRDGLEISKWTRMQCGPLELSDIWKYSHRRRLHRGPGARVTSRNMR